MKQWLNSWNNWISAEPSTSLTSSECGTGVKSTVKMWGSCVWPFTIILVEASSTLTWSRLKSVTARAQMNPENVCNGSLVTVFLNVCLRYFLFSLCFLTLFVFVCWLGEVQAMQSSQHRFQSPPKVKCPDQSSIAPWSDGKNHVVIANRLMCTIWLNHYLSVWVKQTIRINVIKTYPITQIALTG